MLFTSTRNYHINWIRHPQCCVEWSTGNILTVSLPLKLNHRNMLCLISVKFSILISPLSWQMLVLHCMLCSNIIQRNKQKIVEYESHKRHSWRGEKGRFCCCCFTHKMVCTMCARNSGPDKMYFRMTMWAHTHKNQKSQHWADDNEIKTFCHDCVAAHSHCSLRIDSGLSHFVLK